VERGEAILVDNVHVCLALPSSLPRCRVNPAHMRQTLALTLKKKFLNALKSFPLEQILALTFGPKSLKPLKLIPLRSEADQGVGSPTVDS